MYLLNTPKEICISILLWKLREYAIYLFDKAVFTIQLRDHHWNTFLKLRFPRGGRSHAFTFSAGVTFRQLLLAPYSKHVRKVRNILRRLIINSCFICFSPTAGHTSSSIRALSIICIPFNHVEKLQLVTECGNREGAFFNSHPFRRKHHRRLWPWLSALSDTHDGHDLWRSFSARYLER